MAMSTIVFFTPEQDASLAKTSHNANKRNRNPAHKRYPDRDPRGPDCYIIAVPPGGIKHTELSTDDEHLKIFGVDCEIVNFEKYTDDEDVVFDTLVVVTTARKVKVFNPYPVSWYAPSSDNILYIKAFRHKQGHWLCEKPPYHIKVQPLADINPGEEGDCTVIGIGIASEAEPEVIKVRLGWMSGEEKVRMNAEATAVYRDQEGIWEFDGVECVSVTP